MATSEEIFRDAMTLPPEARTELTERLVESLAQDISPEIATAQLPEVRHYEHLSPAKAGSWFFLDLKPSAEALGYCQTSANADERGSVRGNWPIFGQISP